MAAAVDRVGYVTWLAEKLMHPVAGHDIDIRAAAAHELLTFVEDIKR